MGNRGPDQIGGINPLVDDGRRLLVQVRQRLANSDQPCHSLLRGQGTFVGDPFL